MYRQCIEPLLLVAEGGQRVARFLHGGGHALFICGARRFRLADDRHENGLDPNGTSLSTNTISIVFRWNYKEAFMRKSS